MNKDIEGELTGSIRSIEVVSAGIGYSESTTSIRVTPSGVNGGVISANVRSLNVNNNLKYGKSFFRSRLEENNEVFFKMLFVDILLIPFNDDGHHHQKLLDGHMMEIQFTDLMDL